MNLAAVLASTLLFTFTAPSSLDKVPIAEIVRSVAVSLGCEVPVVQFDDSSETEWRGRVTCRRWRETP